MSAFTMYSTPNVTGRGAYCGHCDNHGLVLFTMLDGQPVDHEFAGPCPMCEKGRTLNGAAIRCTADPNPKAQAVAGSAGAWGFWTRHMVHESVWSHGYTSQHSRRCRFQRAGAAYPCGRPTTGTVCEYHEGMSEHDPGASFSVPRLAQIAARMPAPKTTPMRRVLTVEERRKLAEVTT